MLLWSFDESFKVGMKAPFTVTLVRYYGASILYSKEPQGIVLIILPTSIAHGL